MGEMETTCENNLKILKEKFKNDDTAFDSVDMEKCLREFKTELYIKRDQVKQLRANLELSTNENLELKKALDAATKTLNEKTFNLTVITKKYRTSEDELLEKNDILNTIQLQHKLTVTEIDKMKEHLQRNEGEKLELSRKLEVFEAKQRQSFIYHNQILKRETNLKSKIEEVEEMVKKLKLELCEVTELSKKTKLAEEAWEKCQQLLCNYEKLKKEKDHFEELYIRINAKCEMLENLLSMNEEIHEPNLISKIIFNQWKTSRAHYDQQISKANEALNKLTECYNKEKTVNVQLIKQNEEISQDNQRLIADVAHLKELFKIETNKPKQNTTELVESVNNNNGNVNVAVKDEPIEIQD